MNGKSFTKIAATAEERSQLPVFLKKSKLFLAGVIAVLIGFPLARQTFADSLGSWIGAVVDTSVYGSEGSD